MCKSNDDKCGTKQDNYSVRATCILKYSSKSHTQDGCSTMAEVPTHGPEN